MNLFLGAIQQIFLLKNLLDLIWASRNLKIYYIGFETDKFPSKTVHEITTLEDLENIPNLEYLNKKLNKKIIKKLVYVQKKNREKKELC